MSTSAEVPEEDRDQHEKPDLDVFADAHEALFPIHDLGPTGASKLLIFYTSRECDGVGCAHPVRISV
jgi:hypothetical protein